MKQTITSFKKPFAALALALLLFFVAGMQQVQAQYNTQTIKLASIAASRFGDYTMNGTYMVNSTRAKLLNTANFGAGGTVSNPYTITDAFGVVGSITVAALNNYDVLFVAANNPDGGAPAATALTAAEITAIRTWSLQPGKVVIVGEQPTNGFNPLSVAYGYPTVNAYVGPTIGTAADASTIKAFSGPFGILANAAQGGSAQGIFTPDCFSQVVARDNNGKSTFIFDAPTRDLVLADGDYLTTVSPTTNAATITNNQDKFIGNIFAWAVREVLAPGVAKNNINATASCTAAGVGLITFNSPIGNSSGGAAFPYSYSIDNVTFQASPTFNNLANGPYTIYAKTAECAVQNGGTVTVACAPCSIALATAGTNTQTKTVGTAITPIVYNLVSATGATISPALPAGLVGTYNAGANTYTISGTPTAISTYNYTVTATGTVCSGITATGTITVNAPCAAAAQTITKN